VEFQNRVVREVLHHPHTQRNFLIVVLVLGLKYCQNDPKRSPSTILPPDNALVYRFSAIARILSQVPQCASLEWKQICPTFFAVRKCERRHSGFDTGIFALGQGCMSTKLQVFPRPPSEVYRHRFILLPIFVILCFFLSFPPPIRLHLNTQLL
jgi:hypothetical protein